MSSRSLCYLNYRCCFYSCLKTTINKTNTRLIVLVLDSKLDLYIIGITDYLKLHLYRT